MEQPDGNEKVLRSEAAMPTLEVWPQERGGDENEKRNCKLFMEQSGVDNLQFCENQSVAWKWIREQPDGNEKALRCEAAMPTLEAWLQERGGMKTKKNCKLSMEQSGMDNLQSA